MVKGIYHSAAGMLPTMNQQETVGNNLANVNTTGFKADKRYFRTALNNSLLQGGKAGETHKMEDDSSLQTDFSQGAYSETRNPLDIAINGEGFFTIETGETVSFTRNGNFALSPEGYLVTNQGYRVMGEEGPVRVAGKDVTIRYNGEVVVDGKGTGTLRIAAFEDTATLKRNGYGMFIPENEESIITSESLELRQGFLEDSNVDPIAEMIQMIELNRNYESCQKSIQAQDETLKLAVNELPK